MKFSRLGSYQIAIVANDSVVWVTRHSSPYMNIEQKKVHRAQPRVFYAIENNDRHMIEP